MKRNEILLLVSQAKEGDQFSWNLLLEKFLNLGQKIIHGMNLVNEKSLYETSDYSLLIYESVKRSIEKYENQIDSIEAFIIQRMKRDIFKHFSRLISKKNLECMKTKCDLEGYECADVYSTPEDYCSYCMMIENIKEAIKSFDKEQKIICKYLIQGYKYQEITDKLNKSYSYIYRRINEIREKLKDLI